MKHLKHSTYNWTNPGALSLRLCVWVWPGDHEDGRLAHVHLRHLLHTQALPREGGRLQTNKGIMNPLSCRAASTTHFSAFTPFGSLPAPPSSSLATTLLPSGSGRRWTIHVGKYQNALCIFTCLKESFAWRIESSHDKEIQHDKWRLWSNCGGH